MDIDPAVAHADGCGFVPSPFAVKFRDGARRTTGTYDNLPGYIIITVPLLVKLYRME